MALRTAYAHYPRSLPCPVVPVDFGRVRQERSPSHRIRSDAASYCLPREQVTPAVDEIDLDGWATATRAALPRSVR